VPPCTRCLRRWNGGRRRRRAWRAPGVRPVRRSRLSEALDAERSGARPVFARPAGLAEVWRERPFEGVLDGIWISGVFDRVVIERDAAGGAPTRVMVIDFKSDRVEGGEQIQQATGRHAGQLDLYRRVAAVLTGVSPAGLTANSCLPAPARRSRCHRLPNFCFTEGKKRRTVRKKITQLYGNLKKKRRLKMNKHKRRKRLEVTPPSEAHLAEVNAPNR